MEVHNDKPIGRAGQLLPAGNPSANAITKASLHLRKLAFDREDVEELDFDSVWDDYGHYLPKTTKSGCLDCLAAAIEKAYENEAQFDAALFEGFNRWSGSRCHG